MPTTPIAPGPRSTPRGPVTANEAAPAVADQKMPARSVSTTEPASLEHTPPSRKRGRSPINTIETTLRQEVLEKIQRKGTPYAVKPTDSANPHLNAQVLVTASDQQNDTRPEAVVCRHLAMVFAQQPGKKREMTEVFSTPEGIRNRFDGKLTKINAAFFKSLEDAPTNCKHVVRSDMLGNYLASLAETLSLKNKEENLPSQANCVLITSNHVMALHLEKKSKGMQDYFAAKLFDPNVTDNYKRVEHLSPQDLRRIELKDMLIDSQALNAYAGGENKPLSMVAVSLDHRLQPLVDRSSNSPSAENMHVALSCGVVDDFRSLLEAGKNQSLNKEKHFHLLAAKSPEGVPGLYMAFQRGYANTVASFLDHVLTSDEFNNAEKIQLLEAKSASGTPGLHLSFFSGHTTTVCAFTERVLASPQLTNDEKVSLLSAKAGGFSGLYLAACSSKTETVTQFVQKVAASELPAAHKRTLTQI